MSIDRRTLLLGALALVADCALAAPFPWKPKLTRERRDALERVSAASLRGHLSFLASDLLEGRGTPSRGLDLAAEYIAAQFRRAGLEPVGEAGSYFQTVRLQPRGASAGQAVQGVVKAANVVGLLRGSDPALADSYVLVTAHYDHLGIREGMEGDNIFNGANDDGSGTVSVIELASALSSLKVRPRRSILFMTFCGEERGLVGSRYYGAHPLFPIEKTVAHINLEQVGRTDDSEGPRVGAMSMTGFDFSDIGPIFAAAGKEFGVAVDKHPRNSDAFFGRSDNQALADLGIPAHTLCTAFVYPDYHRASDHWDKVDYDNMAKVLKMVGLGVLTIADTSEAPRWNLQNPKAARYVEAWRKLHPEAAAR